MGFNKFSDTVLTGGRILIFAIDLDTNFCKYVGDKVSAVIISYS